MKTHIPELVGTLDDQLALLNSLTAEARGIMATAAREQRALEPSEELDHDQVLAAIKTCNRHITRLEQRDAPLVVRDTNGQVHDVTAALTGRAARGANSATSPNIEGRTLGELVAAHPAIQQLRAHGAETPVVFTVEQRAVTGAVCGALLAPAAPPPSTPLPGLTVSRPPRVSDLLPNSAGGDALCSYLQVTARSGNAAVVPPATAKPDVGINGQLLAMIFEKIAGWTTITDELLEDAPALARVLDVELRRALSDALDIEILTSVGSATSFVGLRPGATGPDTSATGLSPIAALATAAGALFDASGLYPDSITVNGATAAACGSVLAATAGTFLTGPPTLVGTATPPWAGGLRVAISPSMPNGIGLIGNYSEGAALVSKKGISMKADSSGTNFIANVTLLRAEVRVALAILHPLAFAEVTGLPAPA